MLVELLKRQHELLARYFEAFDTRRALMLFEELKACPGVLFFTGVGKSGLIAQKIASTLMSTGTKSFFLSPTDALHGDLGMVSTSDSVIALSKSGETEELLQLMPSVRNKGAKIVAITSNPSSRLVKASDLHLELPCEAELCPFDLAPTISTSIQLLFGDLMAIYLMEAKGFTANDFALNHPGGRLGKRSSLRVRDLMLKRADMPLASRGATLQEVLADFSEKRCGCLVIVDSESRLEGIFTDGDLRRALQGKGERVLEEKLHNLMTKAPRAIHIDALAFDALKLMEADQKRPITVLPVLSSEGTICGLIKMHDIIQAGL